MLGSVTSMAGIAEAIMCTHGETVWRMQEEEIKPGRRDIQVKIILQGSKHQTKEQDVSLCWNQNTQMTLHLLWFVPQGFIC